MYLRIILGGALFLAGFVGTVQAQYAQKVIKGEFIERFTRFTEWPKSITEADTTNPFLVVIIGQCPFERHMISAFTDRRIMGRKTKVTVLPLGASIPQCQVLFIAKSERSRLSKIVQALKDRPVLTVSNTKGFARSGVHINLYKSGRSLRFEVNLNAVRVAGLRISSKMLKHAKIIE